MKKENLAVGQKVHYAPDDGKKENGIINSITKHDIFVVYNCVGDWANYRNYTGCNTPIALLRPGWVRDAMNASFCKFEEEKCDHEYINDSYKWGNPNRMACIHCGHVINN